MCLIHAKMLHVLNQNIIMLKASFLLSLEFGWGHIGVLRDYSLPQCSEVISDSVWEIIWHQDRTGFNYMGGK